MAKRHHNKRRSRPQLPIDGRLAAVLGALSALLPLSIDLYLPCFDAMAASFQVASADIAWSLPTFFAGLFVGQLVWGPLSDRVGRKRPMLYGLAAFTLSSAGCAQASTLLTLIVWRAVQAFSGAAGLVVARAMVRDCFVGAQAVRMVATLMLVQGMAPMVGPSVGSVVQAAAGWRGVFWLLAALGTVLWLVCLAFVPETHHAKEHSLTLRHMARRYASLLGDASFMRYALSGAVAGASLFVYLTCAPFVLMDVLSFSPQIFGLIFGGNAFGLWLVGQSNRWLVRRFSPDALLQAGFAVTVAGSTVLLVGVWPALQPQVLLPGLLLFLCGLPLIWPNVSTRALARQGHRAGSAAATQGAMQWGSAALASTIASRWHDGTALPMVVLMAAASLAGASCYAALTAAARSPLNTAR